MTIGMAISPLGVVNATVVREITNSVTMRRAAIVTGVFGLLTSPVPEARWTCYHVGQLL